MDDVVALDLAQRRNRTVGPELKMGGFTPTVAIDVPLKALVWEDDQGKVWLTYNSAEYIQDYVYPRHGLPSNPDAAKATGSVLADFAQKAVARQSG